MVHVPAAARPWIVYAGVLPAALLVLTAGITYSRRRPSPRLGRLADIAEALLGLAVLPVAGAVLGLYAVARGLAG